MCLDILDVNASAKKETVYESTWTIDVNVSDFTHDSSNCTVPLEYEMAYDNSISIQVLYFYRYFAKKILFTTSPDVYGYKISIGQPTSFSLSEDNILWYRPIVGSLDEIVSGTGSYGNDFKTGYSSTIWYKNDYSEQFLNLALMCYCANTSVSGSQSFADFDLSASSKVTVVAYSKEDYQLAMTEYLAEGNELQQENNALQEEANKTSKSILKGITDFFGSFFDNLINSVVSLFVPSSSDMKTLIDSLNQFFSDTFGFLYYPFEFIINAFDIFLNSDSSTGITLPGFEIMGYQVWDNQVYDIGSDELAGTIFGYVRIGTGALLSMAFVTYLRDFFEKRFGGGG